MKSEITLQQYRTLDIAIDNRRAELEKLWARATSVSSSAGGHGGEPSDKVGRLSAIIADEETALLADLEKLSEMKRELVRCIDSLPDMFDRELLRMRYILGYSLEEIAEKTNYSKMQILRKIKKDVTNVTKCY